MDTDRIIPARYLTRVSRSGYGELLFRDVRSTEFPLDKPSAAGATILVTGSNFGCGSSREHAVWAIQQAGFVVVIAKKTATAPGFSDIFRQNSANCGLLLVELDEAAHAALTSAGTGAEATVDLVAQTVRLGVREFSFEINAATKKAVLEGLDLIGTTLVYTDAIDAYESQNLRFVPSSSNA